MPRSTSRRSPLLPHHAFVVQFHADTDVDAGRLMGRVEHVISRQALSFQSLDELLAFIARVLREVRDASSKEGE